MYKRQELESINPNVVDAIARLGCSVSEDLAVISNLTVQAFERLVTIDKNEMRLSRKALRKEPVAIQPVSYTHLDVYKRQIH